MGCQATSVVTLPHALFYRGKDTSNIPMTSKKNLSEYGGRLTHRSKANNLPHAPSKRNCYTDGKISGAVKAATQPSRALLQVEVRLLKFWSTRQLGKVRTKEHVTRQTPALVIYEFVHQQLVESPLDLSLFFSVVVHMIS
ncbi:hypothetical protein D5086_031774 [Populus alba]|uniref:Uncharacterized protein n=1 Tax=Populus alba TaxID=43335 RepID=A0ACC4AK63_POPAL